MSYKPKHKDCSNCDNRFDKERCRSCFPGFINWKYATIKERKKLKNNRCYHFNSVQEYKDATCLQRILKEEKCNKCNGTGYLNK